MSSNIAVTGVKGVSAAGGAVPLRIEIRDLKSGSPLQWNLYILGLAALQTVDENDLLSYYQVAGIHGQPYKPWGDVKGIPNFDPSSGGYCTHSSIIFTTWHRPYLALFEMVLYQAVQNVASRFQEPLKAQYVAAAKDFRMPYWDWADRQSLSFPNEISSPQATVTATDGKTKSITNPLYTFRFHPMNPKPKDFDSYWSTFPETLRYPRNGKSNNAAVTKAISNEADSLRSNVSLILLDPAYKDFAAFSHNAWARSGTGADYGSLEDIHNVIHDVVGGGGHMSALAVSSFDPVFWLHHANVDRLWAIWQALNPNSYVVSKPSEGNFTTAANTKEDVNSPLKPFYDASGTQFWTSAGVKSTETFGYAYPETQHWNFKNNADYQKSLTQKITQEYSANALSRFLTSRAVSLPPVFGRLAAFESQAPLDANLQGLPGDGSLLIAQSISTPLKGNNDFKSVSNAGVPAPIQKMLDQRKYTEWVTNVRAIKHGLDQTFRILVFLGDFSTDVKDWSSDKNLVGRVVVLGQGRTNTSGCSKCKIDARNDLVITGTVPLTAALLDDLSEGKVASLEETEVIRYLQRNLHWRVTLFDGTEVPRAQVPGLKVAIASTNVVIGSDGTPQYSGTYQIHPLVTEGRDGGCGAHDGI